MVELTVPWEERIEESFELKKAKYEDLAQTCREGGWKTWVFQVEVGCRKGIQLALPTALQTRLAANVDKVVADHRCSPPPSRGCTELRGETPDDGWQLG